MSFNGTIRVPSDKSISHRAVLFAGLAKGTSHLEDLLPSDDVLSSLAAIRALGAKTDLREGAQGLSGVVTGFAGKPETEGPLTIDCGNSGTTTRLLLGLMCGLGVDATLHGDSSLSKRPMERVMKMLRPMGAAFESDEGHLPVRILPRVNLTGIACTTEQASAQVKSALILAGLQAEGVTQVTEPAKSRDHTELLLPAFGVEVTVNGLTCSVGGPACLHAHDMKVPADPSSAAFVAVAAAVAQGSDVTIENVALNETRIGAFRVLERMGCDLTYLNKYEEGAEPVGDVRVRFTDALAGTVVQPEEIPSLIDEIPVLALAAACAKGETVFKSAGELRVKESDRFQAILDMLDSFGIEAFGWGDDLHVIGTGKMPCVDEPLDLATYHDHRLAMTYYLAGKAFDMDIRVDDPECVSVSWPGFYSDIDRLQG